MPDMDADIGEQSTRLTNDDFRRLPLSSLLQSTMKDKELGSSKTPAEDDLDDRAERRRKKKSFYAKLKKQEEDKMAELAQKYRDRARERRDGGQDQPEDPLSAASGYRAVAPDLKSGLDAAERRRQMIQESKFLGGDMEHTHLVKGLDYALLQKVRSEIQSKEMEEEEELERLAVVKPVERKEEKKEAPQDKEMTFKTKLGRNVFRAAFPSQKVELNEMFGAGRMAYVIELDGDFAETDIPTTLIRSKADVPSLQTNSTLTTNDIVINKLAQILSYLRQGRHGKKGRRKDKPGKRGGVGEDDLNIYPDLAEYEPSTATSHLAAEQRAKKRAPYFSKIEQDPDEGPSARLIPNPSALVNALGESSGSSGKGEGSKAKGMLLNRLATEPEGYAECYPGLEEMQDAIDDSDDEVDYTKMDLGNKKGPVGRWDFDTQEEYSEYMNNKEALPKAAFQYGVKMADGRRTRKFNKEKNEKAELDREWQKIQNIIQKRKGPTSSKDSEPSFKVPRY
ncbi:protein Red isoform X2 [Thrips palmi]|uniref:Protein Red isoform X2 n=1 Tax=Thrips palmi TaxID=161013 RepID=A0A6P8Y3T6_THRPL|nr:protein Red isoform X2 [Thrips palmi]